MMTTYPKIYIPGKEQREKCKGRKEKGEQRGGRKLKKMGSEEKGWNTRTHQEMR